jgi:hypothetical protein
MCSILNQFLIGEVEAEVRRQIAAGTSFTAFDISRAVQATGIRERHRNLKGAVHAMYERGDMPGYDRSVVNLTTGEQPFLYHPKAATNNRFATASARQTAPDMRHLDPWNRLRLPARVLRDAGILPGDTVYAAVETTTAVVTLSSTPIPNAARPYRVDRYNNVRLALGMTIAAITLRFKLEVAGPGQVQAKPK